jgi:coenzyme F420-0:L-glutamate ligase / coenzyme F420-1:gamma-L-glutamate ligase
MSDAAMPLTLTGIRGLPEVAPGADLAALLIAALADMPLAPLEGDVLVVAQKIVSKSESRLVDLASVVPGARAQELAAVTRKDARLVEVILSESTEVVRAAVNVLIVRHRLGFVMANAGVDRSNVARVAGRETVLLLPRDPDASAAALRTALQQHFGVAPGFIISDSFGRPWRKGVVNVALGAAGLPALLNRRGEPDRSGRPLEVTEVAIADAVAAAAGLVMGEAAEGVPVVLIRGLQMGTAAHSEARALIRPLDEDLFR